MTPSPGSETAGAAHRLSARMPALILEAHQVAATVSRGTHGRRAPGPGDTFWQFRRAEPGDDRAEIDWRRSARLPHLYIQQKELEASQSVYLWCDLSGSMDYASNPEFPVKSSRAILVLLALADMLTRGGERVHLLNAAVRPGSDTTIIDRFAAALVGPRGTETTIPDDLPVVNWSRMVLIGDFLDDPEALLDWVSARSAEGIAGHLVQILDPAEETLPFEGPSLVQGLEGEQPLTIRRMEEVRTGYRAKVQELKQFLAVEARNRGWTFASHRTDHTPEGLLLALSNALEPGRSLEKAARR